MDKKAHFIGIGGVGMSATALLLRDLGVEVTGSDEAVYDPVASLLRQNGLAYHTGYAAANIPIDADLIVIGKNAKLVPESNPEVAAAYASGKKIRSFPEVLAEASAGKQNVVVAGSYGKSTSTALLAHVLGRVGLNPSWFIGAVPTGGPPAGVGSGELMVLEGDEYPASNTDPRSKFLLLNPAHVLATPLAHDHLNVFSTPADYLKPFYELANITPGTLVVCTEGPLSYEFIQNCGKSVVTYGVHEGDYTASDIVWGERTTFAINGTRIETSLLGEHNIQNIVGVAALVFSLKLMSPAQFAEAVATFKGIVRRLDRKSEATRIPIFEGFGSSLEKLQSAIAAMRLHFPAKRLLVVFEPHTFSWRNRGSLPWYDHAFAGAGKVYVFEPPQDGKDTQLSLEEIVARVSATGLPCVGARSTEEMLAQLSADLEETDCILLSTSGDLGGLIQEIPALAERRFPRT